MIHNRQKKITIMHLLSSSKYSGAENVACTIINCLSSEYNFIYCSPKGDIEKVLKDKKINYVSLNSMNYTELKDVIYKEKPTIIHAHDFLATYLASKFANKCIVISHLHKNDPAMKRISIKSIAYLSNNNKISSIIGVSNSIYDEYVFKNTIKQKYITIPNYINKNEIINKASKFKIKEQYDYFYIGRLSEEKNPLQFIDIINTIKKDHPKCIMIGDGPLRKKCIAKINKLGLDHNIKLVGFKKNPFPYIAASKVGIMPSRYEGFGLTAIEATILNKPVINSGVGGLSDIYKNTNLIANNIKDYIKIIKNKEKKLPKISIISESEFGYRIREVYIKSLKCKAADRNEKS